MSDTDRAKDAFIARLEAARTSWEELVARAPAELWERPGAMDDWTLKDVMAHLNGWRALTVARLEAVALGRDDPTPPWPAGMSEETEEDVRRVNDWFHAQSRDRQINAVLAEARDQMARSIAALRAIPVTELSTPREWLEGYPISAVVEGTLDHFHQDHEIAIREWIASAAKT
jgi:hypothetical protein